MKVSEWRKPANLRPRNLIRGTIPASEIEAAYRAAFTIATPSLIQRLLRWFAKKLVGAAIGDPFYFADSYYQPVNEAAIQKVLVEDKTEMMKYITEDLDCDDFTFSLMGKSIPL